MKKGKSAPDMYTMEKMQAMKYDLQMKNSKQISEQLESRVIFRISYS